MKTIATALKELSNETLIQIINFAVKASGTLLEFQISKFSAYIKAEYGSARIYGEHQEELGVIQLHRDLNDEINDFKEEIEKIYFVNWLNRRAENKGRNQMILNYLIEEAERLNIPVIQSGYHYFFIVDDYKKEQPVVYENTWGAMYWDKIKPMEYAAQLDIFWAKTFIDKLYEIVEKLRKAVM